MNALAELAGLDPLDARRFRPSVLIETEAGEGFMENDWMVSRGIKIGDADIRVTEASRRCGMTLFAQPGLSEEPDVLRGIMRHNKRNLGVYATPPSPSPSVWAIRFMPRSETAAFSRR